MPTIYIDVLFFINLCINALLIYCTGKIMHIKMSFVRIFCGSVVSALYAVCMFFPNLNIFYTTASKLIFSVLIIAISYKLPGYRLFFKTLGLFYLVTILFGGSVFMIFCFTGLGSTLNALIKNGVLYFDLPWKILFVSILFSSVFSVILLKYIFKKSDKSFAEIYVSYNGKFAYFTALIDTGNTLCDPITHESVIVAEYDTLKEILPPDFNSFSNLPEDANVLSRMRIIPFSSIGKENGILIGFKPDKIIIQTPENTLEITDVIIGISNASLSKDKSFQALMPPGIIM